MCLGPVCHYACLVVWIEFLRKFYERTKEWPKHEDDLKKASIFLSDLDADRNRLSSGRLIRGGWQKVDADIKKARSMLEEIRGLVDWTRDETCCRSGLKTGSVEFAF